MSGEKAASKTEKQEAGARTRTQEEGDHLTKVAAKGQLQVRGGQARNK